jgi:hypothetical protein
MTHSAEIKAVSNYHPRDLRSKVMGDWMVHLKVMGDWMVHLRAHP